MSNVTIKLRTPIQGHGKLITHVVLREPTYDEYLEFGDPFLWAPSPGSKVPYVIPDNGAIAAYARCLVVEPSDPIILAQGGFELAREIRNVILRFFGLVVEAGGDSGTSPTSSHSDSDKISSPSAG